MQIFIFKIFTFYLMKFSFYKKIFFLKSSKMIWIRKEGFDEKKFIFYPTFYFVSPVNMFFYYCIIDSKIDFENLHMTTLNQYVSYFFSNTFVLKLSKDFFYFY